VELKVLSDGTWVKFTALVPGHYEYRFILGSSWVSDPTNPETRSNPMGEPNSILRIPGQRRIEMILPVQARFTSGVLEAH
jgi:hypothetical protein